MIDGKADTSRLKESILNIQQLCNNILTELDLIEFNDSKIFKLCKQIEKQAHIATVQADSIDNTSNNKIAYRVIGITGEELGYSRYHTTVLANSTLEAEKVAKSKGIIRIIESVTVIENIN